MGHNVRGITVSIWVKEALNCGGEEFGMRS